MVWVNMDTKGNLTPKPVKFEGDDCGISTLCFTKCNWLPGYLIAYKINGNRIMWLLRHSKTRLLKIWFSYYSSLMPNLAIGVCVPSLCKPFSGGWGTYCWRTKIPALFYFLFISEWCINSVYPSLPILIIQSWYFSFSKLLVFDIVTVWNFQYFM